MNPDRDFLRGGDPLQLEVQRDVELACLKAEAFPFALLQDPLGDEVALRLVHLQHVAGLDPDVERTVDVVILDHIFRRHREDEGAGSAVRVKRGISDRGGLSTRRQRLCLSAVRPRARISPARD